MRHNHGFVCHQCIVPIQTMDSLSFTTAANKTMVLSFIKYNHAFVFTKDRGSLKAMVIFLTMVLFLSCKPWLYYIMYFVTLVY